MIIKILPIVHTSYSTLRNITRKPCCRKETTLYRSCSFRFRVRRQRSLQV